MGTSLDAMEAWIQPLAEKITSILTEQQGKELLGGSYYFVWCLDDRCSEDAILEVLVAHLGLRDHGEWSREVADRSVGARLEAAFRLLHALDAELVRRGHQHLVLVVDTWLVHPNVTTYFFPKPPHPFHVIHRGPFRLGSELFRMLRKLPQDGGTGLQPTVADHVDVVKQIARHGECSATELCKDVGYIAQLVLDILGKYGIAQPSKNGRWVLAKSWYYHDALTLQ